MRTWKIIHFDRTGPTARSSLRSDQVIQLLLSGELTWVDLARPTGPGEWRRLYDVEDFGAALPELPLKMMKDLEPTSFTRSPDPDKTQKTPVIDMNSPTRSKIRAHSQAHSATRSIATDVTDPMRRKALKEGRTIVLSNERSKAIWFVGVGGAEFGPLEPEELKQVLKAGKLKGQIRLWNETLKNWTPVAKFPAFASLVPGGESQLAQPPADRRTGFRQVLVASIMLAHNLREVGFCSNISPDGLQIAIGSGDPGIKQAEEVILTVVPIGVTGHTAFHVRAKVAWVNPQIGRAGFQFMGMEPRDQEALHRFLGLIHERRTFSSGSQIPKLE
jgi:hypothetical protein